MTYPALTRKFLIIMTIILSACSEPVTYAPVKTVNQAVAPDNGYAPRGLPQAATNDPFGQEPPNTNQQALTLPKKSAIQEPPSDGPDKLANWYPLQPTPSNPTPFSRPSSNLPLAEKLTVPPYKPSLKLPRVTADGKQNKGKSAKNATNKPQKANIPALKSMGKNDNNLLKSYSNTYTVEKTQVQHAKMLDKPELTEKNSKKSTISIDNKKLLKLNFQWPLRGRILRSFSQTDNKGIEISGKTGQTVYASEAGKAVYCGQGLTGLGNLAIIKHNDTYLSAYANNSKLTVKEGQLVGKGQAIGQLGLRGLKKASLHFEIRKNGKPINPLTLLPRH